MQVTQKEDKENCKKNIKIERYLDKTRAKGAPEKKRKFFF